MPDKKKKSPKLTKKQKRKAIKKAQQDAENFAASGAGTNLGLGGTDLKVRGPG